MGLEQRTGKFGAYWGNTYDSSTSLKQSQMEVNAKYIYSYLSSEGWTLNAIAGILGNMQSESSINPGRWESDRVGGNPDSHGYGLVQWTPYTKYTNWVSGDPSTMDNNISRILYEVDNNIEQEDKIKVHIVGEVQTEGIIEIEKDARLADVIEEAGGITDEADLSKINLAYCVKDGQKIYIPNMEDNLEEYIIDDAGDGVLPEEDYKQKNEKVNINTAKQTELETLSGIGPSTALKIINYRKENGEFKNIEDLKNVPGIGDSKFEAIKDDICI